MSGCLKNQNGSALVGVLLAVIIIAALVYGGMFYWGKTNQDKSDVPGLDETAGIENPARVNSPAGALDALAKAKEDIKETNQITENRKQITDQIMGISPDNLEISSVKAGDIIYSPVTIKGTGLAVDNMLVVELRNLEHGTMVMEPVEIKADKGKSGPFQVTLGFEFNNTAEGYIAVYERAIDGSEMNLVEIPVKFGKN